MSIYTHAPTQLYGTSPFYWFAEWVAFWARVNSYFIPEEGPGGGGGG
jgi:hypothetical protein